MKNPRTALIIIGNEILSGRTQDLNVKSIAEKLATRGLSLSQVRIIPDVEDIIIKTVHELAADYTYVFTTGGIGATHDDITASCIAKAFNRSLILDPIADQLLSHHYKDAYNKARQRMAYVPESSELIPNPISAAPGFKINNVYCLAGIPMVMQAMFDHVLQELTPGDPILSKTVCTKIPENNIADELGDIQKEHPDVEIGSYPRFSPPKSYELSLVVRGTDEGVIMVVVDKLIALIHQHGEQAQLL